MAVNVPGAISVSSGRTSSEYLMGFMVVSLQIGVGSIRRQTVSTALCKLLSRFLSVFRERRLMLVRRDAGNR